MKSCEVENIVKVVPMDTLLSNHFPISENPKSLQYDIPLFTYPRPFIVCVSYNGLLNRVVPSVQWANQRLIESV